MTDLEQIRVRCAEAMGYEILIAKGDQPRQPMGRLPDNDWVALPDYPTSYNAAFTLVDAMKAKGFELRLSSDLEYSVYTAQFVDDENSFDATAPTAPLAICLAFLNAEGKETE